MQANAFVWSRRGLWAACLSVVVYASYASRRQFLAWHADAEGGAYLIPPYRHMGYFVRYAFTHFLLQYAISFVIAWLFFYAGRRLNSLRGGMLFEREELYFLATGLFVSGHPGWIFYILLVLSAYLLASVIGAVAYGARARVSFYYFWLPCALVTVVLNAYLHQYAWYANLLI